MPKTLKNIEAQISAYHQSESENILKVGEVLYHLLCSAAFNASKAIQAEAAKQQRDPSNLCGHFVAQHHKGVSRLVGLSVPFG